MDWDIPRKKKIELEVRLRVVLREDQGESKKPNCTTSKCSRNVGDRTVAHPHSQQGIGLGGCVHPGPGASKPGGGRIYTKSGLKEI